MWPASLTHGLVEGGSMPNSLGNVVELENATRRFGQVVAVEYLTLDGVAQDPGPSGDFEHRGWTVPYWNDELLKYQSDLLFASDALLLGRVTYEEFVAAWPLRSGDPFIDRMNSLPKFVASKTLKGPLQWNATLLEGDVADEVAKLKQQSDQNLPIYGSGALIGTLMQRNLIDIYQLMLYPIVLGSGDVDNGDRLFAEILFLPLM